MIGIPHGATHSYWRRGNKVFIIWSADFPGDDSGEREATSEEIKYAKKNDLINSINSKGRGKCEKR